MEIDIKKRPEHNNTISLEDFKYFYWLKTELADILTEHIIYELDKSKNRQKFVRSN